ncbi:hypothetical protein BAE44_0014673, partial [Dichanthelium oligosanthes]
LRRGALQARREQGQDAPRLPWDVAPDRPRARGERREGVRRNHCLAQGAHRLRHRHACAPWL